MKTFYLIIDFIIAIVLYTNCSGNNAECTFLDNESLENTKALAHDKGCCYCVVLLDTTQIFSRQYKNMMENNHLESTAVFNYLDVNMPENEWCLKWLCPISLPLTCVFFEDGTLFDLIPGSAKETLLYINEAISQKHMTTFHYVNRFKEDKEHILPELDCILKCFNDIKQGIYICDTTRNSLKYPFSFYLDILGGLMNSDTVSAIKAAEEMLKVESPFFLDMYKKEFITAKKLLNPHFDISKEPNIRVPKEEVTLQYREKDEMIPFDITVFNDGEKDLEVIKVFLSCSCLRLDTSDHFIVPPKDSVKIHLTLTTEQEGEFTREVFITSNAINNPIQYITVSAKEFESI